MILAFNSWRGVMKILTMAGPSLLAATSSPAQSSTPFRCKDQSHLVTLPINNSGETVEGPACAEISINALRYSADFGKTVTYSSGPNLTSIFPSSFSPGGGIGARETGLEAQFKTYDEGIESISRQLRLMQSKNRNDKPK